MNNFFIVTNHMKDREGTVTRQVMSYLTEHGAVCASYFRPEMSMQNHQHANVVLKDSMSIPGNTECIIVLGGDGTLIQAVGALAQRNVPFIGINLGHLGYLTEADSESISAALDALLEDRFQIESRMMVNGEIIRENQVIQEHYALNDVVLSRWGRMQVIHYNLSVNGTYLNTYTADGMIISTPTGSTAYNLSAGGPICFPEADLFVATPICAHTMNTRSLVLPPDVSIELEILDEPGEGLNPVVSFDGGYSVSLQKNDIISVRSSGMRCRLIRLNHRTFLDTLRSKMKSL